MIALNCVLEEASNTVLYSPQSGQILFMFFFFQAEDGIRDLTVTGVQTCALPIWTFDELHIVYIEFKSVIQQRVVVEKLLPIESLDQEAEKLGGGYLFEPDEEEIGRASCRERV